MTLPSITPKQQEILKLHSQYRFMNTNQIQRFLKHKDKKTTKIWLKDLREKHYLEWSYSTKFGDNTKPAIYHMGINGVRFLKTHPETPMTALRKLYRDGKRKESCIQHCLLIADVCLHLLEKSTHPSHVTFSFETANDYAKETSLFHFFTETEVEPVLCFHKQKNNKKTSYLLDVFDGHLPLYSVKKRLRQYVDFYHSSAWEAHLSKTFPILLFICPTPSVLISAKRFTQKLLDELQQPKDLHIRFATSDDVKAYGITGEIWEGR